jgi:hypothetical protein
MREISGRPRVLLRTLGIVLFVVGFVVALFDLASDAPGRLDLVWIPALVVAVIGAILGVLLRKRGAEVRVSNVVWRVAPLSGIAIGVLYMVILVPPGGESSYFGISLLAGAGAGLVWGCLCAGGAVLGSKISPHLVAVAIGSVLGAGVAGFLTSWIFQGPPIYIALGVIITLAICLALALAFRGKPPLKFP